MKFVTPIFVNVLQRLDLNLEIKCHMYEHIAKGQKISEDFLLFFNPSKKTTKMFPHFCPSQCLYSFYFFGHFFEVQAEIRRQFLRFFVGIEDKKKIFYDVLTFMHVGSKLDPLKMLLRFSEARHQIYVSCLVRICLC